LPLTGKETDVARKKKEKQQATPTELELAIMQVLWELLAGTVEDVRSALQEKGRPLAPSSIRTMLAILQEKQYVTREPLRRGYLYRPLVSAEKARKRILRDIVKRAFAGSAAALVSALMRTDLVSEKELVRIKALIKEQEGGR
jgi:BlaI family penicillinase repressor